MQRLIFSSLSIVVVLLGGCAVSTVRVAPPIATTTPTTSPSPHLVAIGDSLTDGASLPNKGDLSYAWQVARTLGDGSPAIFGRGGYTAGELLATLTSFGVHYGGATLIVVEAGTNDVARSIPVERFASEEASLIAYARAGNNQARLLCLGVWHGGPNDDSYDAVIRDACVATGGTFVPLTPLYARGELRNPYPDLHPNVVGQAAIAALVESYAAA